MEILQESVNVNQSRATEIDTGATPLSMQNVLLGIPEKPQERVEKISSISQPWSFTDLVSQQKLLTTLRITTDTTKNTTTPIWSFRNTWRNVFDLHFRSMKDLFTLKSWTLNFLFEFRSTFQQVGQFNVVYSNIPKPLIPYLVGRDAFGSYLIQTQLSHRKVFMGEDSDLRVSLKWLSPFKSSFDFERYYPGDTAPQPMNSLPVVDDYDMGQLMLYVPFPMQVAAGVDNAMSVRIWTYLSDVDYAGYSIADNRL